MSLRLLLPDLHINLLNEIQSTESELREASLYSVPLSEQLATTATQRSC